MSDALAAKSDSIAAAPRDAAGADAAARRARRFYVSLAILCTAAVGAQALAIFLNAHFRKEPVPLKAGLYAFDPTALLPNYALDARQPPPLPKEVEESLGTSEYMNRVFVDALQPDGPASRASVFVSYYTGKPDLVPHHPEECQKAAGWTLIDKEQVEVTIDKPGGGQATIPVAVLVFEPPGGRGTGGEKPPPKTVLYFFYANGEFMTTRKAVQIKTSFPFSKYSFYSKIELDFYGADGRFATRAESIEAGRRFIRSLMPVLLANHYDWDRITAGDAPAAAR